MEKNIKFDEYVSADNIFKQIKDTQYLYLKKILDKIYDELFTDDDKLISRRQILLKNEKFEGLSIELINGNEILISEIPSYKSLIRARREMRSKEYIIEVNKGIYLGKVTVDFYKADVETVNDTCKEVNKWITNEDLEIMRVS